MSADPDASPAAPGAEGAPDAADAADTPDATDRPDAGDAPGMPGGARSPRWVEPASLLDLRWGAYRPRLIAGLAMIVVGTACILGTTAYSLPLLLVGSLMQPAGWAILPSTIGRRVAVPLPVLGFSWLMLGGSGFAWCYAITLAAWLLVRLRPLPSFVVLLFPILWSVALPRFVHDYQEGWVTILTTSAVVVGAAWLATWIAVRFDSWQSVRTLRKDATRLD